MIRVLIADDHTMVREGLRNALEATGSIDVVAEASTGPEAVEKVRAADPDVVLLDVSMPGRGGLETAHELKTRNPRVRILMLTGHPEDHYAIRCLKAGADGYMTKDKAGQELVSAIKKVRDGGKYLSPDLAETIALSLDTNLGKPPHECLSDREFEVMRMISSGMTVSEIAEELHLSVKTISTYRGRILQKMTLKNNAEIMHYAMRHGLV